MAMVSHSREVSGVGKLLVKGFNEGKCSKQGFHERANNVQGEGAREASFPPLHTRFPWTLGKSVEVVSVIWWDLNQWQSMDLKWVRARVSSF